MKVALVFTSLWLCLATTQAQAEKVYLEPGAEITFYDAPTTVVCSVGSVFRRYCRCSSMGLDNQWQLDLVLERNGTTDTLASYPSQPKCEEQMERNPACRP